MEQLKLSFLKELVDKPNGISEEKFGLVWEKSKAEEAVVTQCRESLPVLAPVKSFTIASNPFGPQHIIIEGENYEALSVLGYTYAHQIDVIYIDPPYNTGKNTLKYRDNYRDKQHSYRHSQWLAFMFNRLCLCVDLLTEDGVIFISIDDHEMAHLKLLCDELFGEKNFLGNFVWINRTTPNDAANMFATDHEYILIYAKNKKKFKFSGISKDLSKYVNRDKDPRGPWMPDNPSAASGSEKDRFPIVNPFTQETYYPPKGRYWAFSEKRVQAWTDTGKLVFPKEKGKKFLLKKYLSELKADTNPASSVISGIYTSQGTKELKQIFGEGSPLKYPKPNALMKYLFSLLEKKEGNFLDFFSGSGTTGQAILELNKEDGGQRRFILCNSNENDLCRKVLYPRIRKIVKGYSTEDKKTEILFQQKIDLNGLKKAGAYLEQMETMAQQAKGQYDTFRRSFKDNVLVLAGVKQSRIRVAGTGGNVRYFKTTYARPRHKHTLQDTYAVCTNLLCFCENAYEHLETGKGFDIYEGKGSVMAIYFELPNNNNRALFKALQQIQLPKKLYYFSSTPPDDNLIQSVKNCTFIPIPERLFKFYKELYM